MRGRVNENGWKDNTCTVTVTLLVLLEYEYQNLHERYANHDPSYRPTLFQTNGNPFWLWPTARQSKAKAHQKGKKRGKQYWKWRDHQNSGLVCHTKFVIPSFPFPTNVFQNNYNNKTKTQDVRRTLTCASNPASSSACRRKRLSAA